MTFQFSTADRHRPATRRLPRRLIQLVGVGTEIYALVIGPLVQVLLPRLSVGARGQ